MKKTISLSICLLIALCCLPFSSCTNNSVVSSAAQTEDKPSYKDVKCYGEDELFTSKNTKKKYKMNVRKCGDYLITDYEDGICINKVNTKSSEIVIPEKLEGKPVRKIGYYLDKSNTPKGAFDYVTEGLSYKLTIPKTVINISEEAIGYYPNGSASPISGLAYVTVDENNPVFKSVKGSLYTKDMKWLLYVYFGNDRDSEDWEDMKGVFTVPKEVEAIGPINFSEFRYHVIIGENVRVIKAYLDDYDSYFITIEGYENTEAEKWAKKNKQNFVYLD